MSGGSSAVAGGCVDVQDVSIELHIMYRNSRGMCSGCHVQGQLDTVTASMRRQRPIRHQRPQQ